MFYDETRQKRLGIRSDATTIDVNMMSSIQAAETGAQLCWSQLPPLPDKAGLGAPYAGVSNGQLLVAGGTNFPAAPLWEGGKKVWHDSTYSLASPDSIWQTAGKLPRPLACGTSLTTRQGVLCIGGCDAARHYDDVFLLKLVGRDLQAEALAPLPRPLAYACGAVVGQTAYVAGGLESPDSTCSLRNFWALDLATKLPRWRELEPWPGPTRMLSVAAAADEAFYLISGCELSTPPEGKPTRTYLIDAYRFEPSEGWTRIADLPKPVVAAPSPAAVSNDSRIIVLGADDGSIVGFKPIQSHPGFPKSVFSYYTHTNRWQQTNSAPMSRATAPLVEWNGRFVVASGETRPGVRSPEVWSFAPGQA